MSDPITVHGITLRGSFDRMTAVMKSASLLNLAQELVSDAAKMTLSKDQLAELEKRVLRIRAVANDYINAVAAFDLRSRGSLTPGEIDSGITIK